MILTPTYTELMILELQNRVSLTLISETRETVSFEKYLI